MTHSPNLVAFVAAWEQLRTSAYDDGGGVWTIGYGHTKDVRPGDRCTVEQAQAWLDEELQETSDAVDGMVTVVIEQHHFDALVSFAYNCGTMALRGSTLLARLNEGRTDDAATQFVRWNKDNGKVLRGLLARRAGEILMFTFGDYAGR